MHTCTTVCGNPSNSADGAVTGTAAGKLLVWKGRNVVRILNAHDSAVTVLRSIPSVGVVSGGLDARVRVWFPDVTPGASRCVHVDVRVRVRTCLCARVCAISCVVRVCRG